MARDDPLRTFESLVDRFVRIDATATYGVEDKIDALERLIEQWRIIRHKLLNPLEFEDFIDWKWFADTDRIVFVPVYSIEGKGFRTPPIRLQRKLLAFLLLYHDRYKQVLEIIGGFISKIREDLCTVDFKKTKTGVFRCYTNTRFAANKLRDYGLLKFTQREAYKTWVLSLPGFLVAARALEKPNWEIPNVVKDPWHDLDPFIYTCCAGLDDYPLFVQRLKSICDPNAKIFQTFDEVLHQVHLQLMRYWRVLADPDQPTNDRRALSKQIVDELDQTVGYGEFLNELSACIQIEDILRKADAAAGE